jgi:hypothetical protein
VDFEFYRIPDVDQQTIGGGLHNYDDD